MLIMPTYLNDIVILNINGSDNISIICGISKSKTIKFLPKANLNEKSETF